MTWTAVGMNHLTWFTEVRVRGADAMPRLREIAREKLAKKGEKDNPFSWELLLMFGGIPAALDRHVVEFFPWLFPGGKYQGKRLGVDTISLENVIRWGDRIYAEMRRDAASRRPLAADYFDRMSGEHEQVLDIIESIRKDSGQVYSANLPNASQVPNLPAESIVESPAVATAAGLKPISQPPLPSGIAGTLATRFMWVETVVEAALEGSRDKFVQALVLDGAVGSLKTAKALADDLLAAHAKYLPRFNRRRGLAAWRNG
jgi:alpha-galactosidase